MTDGNNMKNAVIGVDPGLSGGIALRCMADDFTEVFPLPTVGTTKRELDVGALCKILSTWQQVYTIRLVAVEQVHAMPKQGVTSTFTFGKTFGMLIGTLLTLQLPVIFVLPTAWKRLVLAGTTKDKSAAITYCTARFPGVSLIPQNKRTMHDGMADALCIALYAETQVGRDAHISNPG